MNDKKDVLQNFDNTKLFDVVKNHKQYGYNEEVRSAAISILKERVL